MLKLWQVDFSKIAALMNITQVQRGERFRLIDFGSTPLSYRRRLLALGVTRGVEFLVKRIAPLGCPVQIEVRGTSLCLRREEARALVLERI
jgi:ferrous iron transport protein A